MLGHEGYLSSLNKARRKRNQCLDLKYLVLLPTAIVAVGIIVLGTKPVKKPVPGRVAGPTPTGQVGSATPAQTDPAGTPPEEEAAQEEAQKIDNAIGSYSNLDIVQVSDYLNVRETPSTDGKIIGKLSRDGACGILTAEGGRSHVTSGGVEGHINNQYLLTGDETRKKAKESVKLHTTVTAGNLDIRQTPALGPGSVIGQTLRGEHYVVKGLGDDWVRIEKGYVPSEYTEMAYFLNEGRKMGIEAMVINQYDNLVISEVNNYLDVYQEPKSDGEIIGKMASKAAGEILETLGSWYKIKSNPITDYISADPQCMVTGQRARDTTTQNATPKAIINIGVLNMHTEPNTEAKTWTQIMKNRRYPVMVQLDGWVEVDLNSVGERDGSKVDKIFVSTRDNNVEACYALNKTIKFSPAEMTTDNAVSRRSRVIDYALQFVGNSYVRGGISLTEDMDCSGFTIRVMKQLSVSLPHHSGFWTKMDKAVTSGNMCPDDLILYTGNGGQVNHVAIYINNGQVIHATNHKSGIKISTWNYRSPTAIRNVLGD